MDTRRNKNEIIYYKIAASCIINRYVAQSFVNQGKQG